MSYHERDRRLGSEEKEFDGYTYTGTFEGEGFVPTDGSDIQHLSNQSAGQRREMSFMAEFQPSSGMEVELKNDKKLDIAGLFPEDWRGSHVSYKIRVEATRLDLPEDPQQDLGLRVARPIR